MENLSHQWLQMSRVCLLVFGSTVLQKMNQSNSPVEEGRGNEAPNAKQNLAEDHQGDTASATGDKAHCIVTTKPRMKECDTNLFPTAFNGKVVCTHQHCYYFYSPQRVTYLSCDRAAPITKGVCLCSLSGNVSTFTCRLKEMTIFL